MTNREKLHEVFPKTIFIYEKQDDKTRAIMCSDEWLDAEYTEVKPRGSLRRARKEKKQGDSELETWEGIHAQVTAPKGTFDKIWNEAEEDNDEI
jgi:hypothetical protein